MYRRRLPVYHQRQRASSTLFGIILIGVMIGVGFLLLSHWSTAPAPQSAPSTATIPPTLAAFIASPVPTFTTTPEPQARLFIPAVGVNVMVVDTYLNRDATWDVAQLGENAGHLEGTAWFGRPGNIALAGHVEMADGRAGIFARIDRLNKGDSVILMLGSQEQHYEVINVEKVQPDDLSVLYPTSSDQLTLITCNSYNFLDNNYEERVVVVAERVA